MHLETELKLCANKITATTCASINWKKNLNSSIWINNRYSMSLNVHFNFKKSSSFGEGQNFYGYQISKKTLRTMHVISKLIEASSCGIMKTHFIENATMVTMNLLHICHQFAALYLWLSSSLYCVQQVVTAMEAPSSHFFNSLWKCFIADSCNQNSINAAVMTVFWFG